MKLGQKFGLSGIAFFSMLFLMLKKSHVMLPVAVVMLAHVAVASTAVRVEAPLAAHDDGEVASVTALMPEIFPTARTLHICLSLDDSAGGGAELRLGKAQGGRLSLAGTVTSIGFEDGTWFVRGDRHRKAFTATNSATATAGVRTLVVRLRLDADGAPVKIERLEADGQPLAFDGLGGDALKAWLDPRRLDAFKAVSRGGADGVSATVKVHADGSVFILR